MPVAMFVAVTVARGIAAFDESRTVPWIDPPPPTCAFETDGVSASSARHARHAETFRITRGRYACRHPLSKHCGPIRSGFVTLNESSSRDRREHGVFKDVDPGSR